MIHAGFEGMEQKLHRAKVENYGQCDMYSKPALLKQCRELADSWIEKAVEPQAARQSSHA